MRNYKTQFQNMSEESCRMNDKIDPTFLCPVLAEHTVFVVYVRNGSRRVRSQRKSVDWGTMGPALGGAYECYAHISSLILLLSQLISEVAVGKK